MAIWKRICLVLLGVCFLFLLVMARSFLAFVALRARVHAVASRPPPVRAPTFVPQFTLVDGEIYAGRAFFALIPGCRSPVLLTAQHLFGPDGGFSREVAPERLATDVTEIVLRNPETERIEFHFRAVAVPIAGAGTYARESAAGDVAAFFAPARTADLSLPVTLAAPAVRAPVWLVGAFPGAHARLHPAIVSEGADDWLLYEFAKGPRLPGTSGSPVVNARGELVGIQVSGGPNGVGLLEVAATPVRRFLSELIAGCQKTLGG